MPDIKGYRLYVKLGASQVRKRLKGIGYGVRKVETAGRGQAVIVHTATGDHRRKLCAVFDGLIMRSLVGLAFALLASMNRAVFSADSPSTPEVILRGMNDDELAPHGGGNVYAPCVLLDGGVFKMWFGAQGRDGHDRILYAESRDGHQWSRKGVVLRDDSANHVNDPSVVKVDGRYFMFFTHSAKDVQDRIDVATSTDGLKWNRKGVALGPGEPGSWDSLSVGRPAVIIEHGLFKMWFDGRKDFPPNAPVKNVPKSDFSQRSVGYATSKDGLNWIRHPTNPVFGHNAGGVDVKRIAKTLMMVYESTDGTMLTTSDDGIAWTDPGLLVRKSGKDVDAFGHITPCLLIDPAKGVLQLYFGAASAATWDHNQIAVVRLSNELLKRNAGSE